MEHSSDTVRTACDIQIDGRRGTGRPKLTWKKLMENDCREWKHAASQLPGSGPTGVDDSPAPAR